MNVEEFKTAVEEITTNVTKIAREPVLELEPENVTELLQSNESLLCVDEQRQWFPDGIYSQ